MSQVAALPFMLNLFGISAASSLSPFYLATNMHCSTCFLLQIHFHCALIFLSHCSHTVS